MPLVAVDALQEGLGYMLLGGGFRLLGQVAMSGSAETRLRGEPFKEQPFSIKSAASDLVLGVTFGMLDYYRRYQIDLAIEGHVITPEWVRSIDLGKFAVRAAFVGYTDHNHADAILEHASRHPEDWINWWLRLEDNAESNIREWVSLQAETNQQTAAEARSYGYEYFDLSAVPFDQHIQAVVDYLLEHEEISVDSAR